LIRLGRAVSVIDSSQVATARRVAQQCAETARLSEESVGRAALVATELATNIIKHAPSGGTILFGSDEQNPRSLTMVAINSGTGIRSVPEALRDGFSTAGSSGTGLGAIARSATQMDVYTLPDRGVAVFWRRDDQSPDAASLIGSPSRISMGGVCIPVAGEDVSGDSWFGHATRDNATICVADGLGHGEGAATASLAAIRSFADQPDLPIEEILHKQHGALRPTRGAAIGIARIETAQSRVDFTGAGNISAAIINGETTRRLVSVNGIVGHELRKPQKYSYPWTADAVLLMHSDGVSANWSISNYPGLLQHEPALIAAVIYRDLCRGSDDATVVVAKSS
jgi:anti-sigma regulatory factor (Ser/Thr protein kinase)